MNILANCIHKRFKSGCLEILEKAIKLILPLDDMIYLLYCYYQSLKSPFLDKEVFYKRACGMTLGDIMEELLVARDIASNYMNSELRDLERHLSVWRHDAVP